jgi:hypothetical protein
MIIPIFLSRPSHDESCRGHIAGLALTFTFSKGGKKSGVDRLSLGPQALANLLKERGAEIFIGTGGSCRFPASLAENPAHASLKAPFPAGSFGDLRQNLQASQKGSRQNGGK